MFASSIGTSRHTDLLTLSVYDAADHAIIAPSPTRRSSDLSGGTSAGTFGTVTASATAGTYTAIFTGTTAGTVSTLTATVSGVILTTKPNIGIAHVCITGTH